MTRFSRFALAALLLVATSACAMRSPHIADIRNNPGRYENRTVNIHGTVTQSWGIAPFKFYRIDDGTGDVAVLANTLSRTPTRGARVTVKGKVSDVAVLGGNAIGLHLREERLKINRY